jgi:hypothetical protein|tara:strand:- start:110 stop:439 length:330 start_codon:yes stop_codon:yes gene_type:complete
MKNLILLFSLLFFKPDPTIEGVWQVENNKENLLVVYVHEDNIQFYNYHMDKPFYILEEVDSAESSHVHTTYQDFITNDVMWYTYTLKNDDTLIRQCDETDNLTIFKRLK